MDFQITPIRNAPAPMLGFGEHPFLLEFGVQNVTSVSVNIERQITRARQISYLLNLFLEGHTEIPSNNVRFAWAYIPGDAHETRHLQLGYNPGQLPTDDDFEEITDELPVVENSQYFQVDYLEVAREDGLRIPDRLDELFGLYISLTEEMRSHFDIALYWLSTSSDQWSTSTSAAYASLVTAIEALIQERDQHDFTCPVCGQRGTHESPGATRRFRGFVERYAPGTTPRERDRLYEVRSRIVHGAILVARDRVQALVISAAGMEEQNLYRRLSVIVRLALLNWLVATASR